LGTRTCHVVLEEEDGWFIVQCVELRGAISQGRTREEAIANIKEAIEGYLEAFPEESERLRLKKDVLEITV